MLRLCLSRRHALGPTPVARLNALWNALSVS
jgi:hypothetical protein